jgi:hypothetical protein
VNCDNSLVATSHFNIEINRASSIDLNTPSSSITKLLPVDLNMFLSKEENFSENEFEDSISNHMMHASILTSSVDLVKG